MLNAEALEALKNRRNLLAFSGGGDSTALFFLLIEAGIPFDIALVNYHTRPQSDDEAAYARTLAEQYAKTCHIHDTRLDDANFEHEARRTRYRFFESLIVRHRYDNLITAHQLDDRLEWLLMQLCKGSGLPEMLGMQTVEQLADYTLVRPLLAVTKNELLRYLENCNHRWYEDDSNRDTSYKRNYFRRHFAGPMIEQHAQGIKKSFEYLDEDNRALTRQVPVAHVDRLFWFPTPDSRRAVLTTVDKTLKQCGFLMRQGDKERLKTEDTVIVGRRYVVTVTKQWTFIVPHETILLDKPFKERCRLLGIDPKMRPYLARVPKAFDTVASLLGGGGSRVDLHGER